MAQSSDDGQKRELLDDFLSMCRLCLTKSNVKVNIFNENQSVSLPLRIMLCASLEVSALDSLPKRMCDDCRYQLEKSYVFRKRCKNSDTKLRRYLRQLNSGKMSHLFENSDDEEEYAESQDFFNARQQEKMLLMEKERLDKERNFQQRMKNFMEEEQRRFHEDITKRILEEDDIPIIEKRAVTHTGFTSIQDLGSGVQTGFTSIQHLGSGVQMKKDAQTLIVTKREVEEFSSKMELEDETDLFEEEKIDQINEDYEAEEHVNPERNDDEIEFILNDEPENDESVNPENNMDESVEYEENDEEEGTDFETEDVKETGSNTSKEPLVLNRNLKSSISMGAGELVLSLKADKTNQYIIKPGKSKRSEVDEQGQESDSKNVIDKSGPIDDIDFVHLTKAVRAILAQQVGLNVNGDVNFKVLKRRENVAEVEVRTEDGTIIVLEVELDSMLKENNGELKIFGCTQCSRAFSRKALLKRHESTHVKEKGISCEYCEKWFPSKSGLDRHVRVHTGEKPFKCNVCGKCFIQKEILKRHTMVHTGERPFKCEFCDKSFIQNDMLRFHINRKHSDNPVVELRKCPLCSKTFQYASGLSRHLTVHTGKIFPCLYCPKKFNDGSAHKRHVTTVHRMNNFDTLPTTTKTQV